MAINFVISVDPNVTAILKAVASGLTNNGTQLAQVQADLAELKEAVIKMNADIKAAGEATTAAFTAIQAAVDNIVTDLAGLNAKIEAGQTLTQEDKDVLSAIVGNANALATRVRSVADSTPDEVPPAA